MLIAEEFFLLAHDERTGKAKTGSLQMRAAIPGALLVELVVRERIAIAPHDLGWRERDKVTVLLDRTTEDRILDEALLEVQKRAGKSANSIVQRWANGKTGRHFIDLVAGRLVAAGILGQERHKALGIFPVAHYPERDPGPEAEVRARVNAALLGASTDQRTAILIAMLLATRTLTKVLSPETDPKAAKRAAKRIAEQEITSTAVKAAIEQVIASAGASAAAAGGGA